MPTPLDRVRGNTPPVELPVGHQLLRHLGLELSKIEKIGRLASAAEGVRRTVSYEDLDADKSIRCPTELARGWRCLRFCL